MPGDDGCRAMPGDGALDAGNGGGGMEDGVGMFIWPRAPRDGGRPAAGCPNAGEVAPPGPWAAALTPNSAPCCAWEYGGCWPA